MTFSIVAVDKESKEIGFGISSCTWNAGMVGTARAELGAICSQAKGHFPFHAMFYRCLGENKSLPEIIEEFRQSDSDFESRQVGLVSFTGEAAAFTGKDTDEYTGHIVGNGFACQGNILTGRDVLENMVEGFEGAEGMLAERLFASLDAGDSVGGDIRGRMSARILVKKKGAGMDGTYIDLSVEDHDNPVGEIGRLLSVRRKIYKAYLLQMEVSEADERDKIGALKKMNEYLLDKVDRTVIDYHSFVGQTALELGLDELAIDAFRRVLKIGPRMVDSFKRQTASGVMPEKVLDAVLGEK